MLLGQFGLHGLLLVGGQLGQVFPDDGVLGEHQFVEGFLLFDLVRSGAALAQCGLVGVHVAALVQYERTLRIAFGLLHGKPGGPGSRDEG